MASASPDSTPDPAADSAPGAAGGSTSAASGSTSAAASAASAGGGSTNAAAGATTAGRLQGQRVALVGRLASMSKREAARLLCRHGAVVLDKPGANVDLLVIGEHQWPLPSTGDLEQWLDEATCRAAAEGRLRVVSETQLWEELGLVDRQPDIHRLYTPAMLADLLGVPVAVVRRWHRRGLIVPVCEVRRLPYFDFQEVATARRLAELLAAGVSPRAIEKKLEALARFVPSVKRPLAQLSVIVEGREILLRQGDGLIEPGGQLRFDFEAWHREAPAGQASGIAPRPAETSGSCAALPEAPVAQARPAVPLPQTPAQLRALAAELEDDGQLAAAGEMYRAAMAAGGPQPELCFQLAEVLYRLGDLAGARERYYTAIELDEEYVEARANLGCVLAETGQHELAVAAFQGALALHPEYADVHYHLARTLDELGEAEQARQHWEAFLRLAPESPWAETARSRLAMSGQ